MRVPLFFLDSGGSPFCIAMYKFQNMNEEKASRDAKCII
jgi:hypothetical protein